MTTRVIDVTRESTSQPEAISPPLAMPSLVWQMLSQRGYTSCEQINELTSPSLQSMRSPLTLTDMGLAIERLERAYREQETVSIYGDFDLDGTSGLALLRAGLEGLGFKHLLHYQPRRLTDGYGLHAHRVKELAEKGAKVIVSVDVGITALEAAEMAKSLGVDLIVTDHHLPKETLPDAYAVINPNRGNCLSGLGHLCGAGVAFYLVLALRHHWQKKGFPEAEFNPKTLLDRFVIGTLTDMVPLKDENRALVKHGLLELAKTSRPGLKLLLEELGLWGRPLTAQDVAIRFAPKLNALSRMDAEVLPLDLFLAADEDEARGLLDLVMKSNSQRVELQAAAEAEALDRLRESGVRGCAWVWSENFHKGVVGLVATKVAQVFGVPAFVGSQAKDGTISGSARTAGGRSVLKGLEAAAPFLHQFGGHDPASGFELHLDQAHAFGLALSEYYSSLPELAEEKAASDGRGSIDELNTSMMKWLDALGPYGSGFPPPVFEFEGAIIKGLRWLKDIHLKITLTSRRGGIWDALWFSAPKDHPKVQSMSVGQTITLTGEPQWNYFRGRQTIQLLVK